jgi:hypothetical protein
LKRSIAFAILLLLTPGVLWSDSPITNTAFYKAYLDFKIVEKAEKKGYLDQELASYLLSPKPSLDLKAAIINALSFEILGKDNAERFISFLNKKYNSDDFVEYKDQLNADELFCLGYFMVMDDYFNPDSAIPYLEKAKKLKPNDYSINMILAITTAQSIFNIDKCKAWELVNEVVKNDQLEIKMLPEAEEIILTYFRKFESEC